MLPHFLCFIAGRHNFIHLSYSHLYLYIFVHCTKNRVDPQNGRQEKKQWASWRRLTKPVCTRVHLRRLGPCLSCWNWYRMGGGDLCCEENYVSRASTAAAAVYVCAEERFHHAFPDATPFHPPPPPFSLFVRKDLNLSERQEFESYDLYTTRSKDLFQHSFNMVGSSFVYTCRCLLKILFSREVCDLCRK